MALDGVVITCDAEGRVIGDAPGGRHKVERMRLMPNNQVLKSILGLGAGVLAPFDGL